jgi:hypothetical protein
MDENFVCGDQIVILFISPLQLQVISIVCIAVWAINIGHFNDPAHGGSWLKVGYKVCVLHIMTDYNVFRTSGFGRQLFFVRFRRQNAVITNVRHVIHVIHRETRSQSDRVCIFVNTGCHLLFQDRCCSGRGRHSRGSAGCHHHLPCSWHPSYGQEERHCPQPAVRRNPWLHFSNLLG